jgi:hypothetical protein
VTVVSRSLRRSPCSPARWGGQRGVLLASSTPCRRSAAPTLALASSLLCLAMDLCSCFNPVHYGEAVPRENHVPVVDALPPPSFQPLPAQVGPSCAPLEFQLRAVDDADGDVLTVRFDIVLERNERPSRVLLRESPPIRPLEDDSYPLTDLTSLVLEEDVLSARLGDLDAQKGRTQLLELRVSDAGFAADENGDPVPDGDGGVAYFSWQIALQDCRPVTP